MFCEQHPYSYIFIEATQKCIPINACLSDDNDVEEDYCVHTDLIYPGADAIEKFLNNVWFPNSPVKIEKEVLNQYEINGKYYVGYTITGGQYVVFEFGGDKRDVRTYARTVCWVHGAHSDCNMSNCLCKNIACKTIKSTILDIYSLAKQDVGFFDRHQDCVIEKHSMDYNVDIKLSNVARALKTVNGGYIDKQKFVNELKKIIKKEGWSENIEDNNNITPTLGIIDIYTACMNSMPELKPRPEQKVTTLRSKKSKKDICTDLVRDSINATNEELESYPEVRDLFYINPAVVGDLEVAK